MDLDEIQRIFFQECEEGLTEMEANFALLSGGGYDPETINALFRCVHSIKGGAGAFGHDRLQAYAHQYESLLDAVRASALAPAPRLLGIMLGAFDMLADHVAAAREGLCAPDDEAMLDRLASAIAGDDGAGSAGETVPAPVTSLDEPLLQAIAPLSDPAMPQDDFADLICMLEEAAANDGGPAMPAPAPGRDVWHLVFRPVADAFAHGAEPLLLLRELALLGGEVTACDCSALPPLESLDPSRACLGWQVQLPADVAEDDILTIFEFCDDRTMSLSGGPRDRTPMPATGIAAPRETGDDDPVTPRPNGPVPNADPPATDADAAGGVAAAPQMIRVDLDKLDRLVNLVGELVITQAMVAQRLSRHDLAGATELADLEHLTRELQESTMAIRAQPMKAVFNRVPRIIRELENATGKRVRLDIEGGMTEVDKTVVERIGEPLTHLIRNAVDHGIESPEDRIAAGKSPEGIVRLSAAHQSGRVLITVADDGRGIDRARVRAKAIERGIVAADAHLSDEDVDNLIFTPGFSTASAITSYSGRGVGMDVVRKAVHALGGRIVVQSRAGMGSSFALSLPLTLAVLDGMIVTVGAQTLVIPLGHIVESLRPRGEALVSLGRDGTLLDVRGAFVRVVPIADRLGIADAERDPTQAVLIVVDSDHGQAALLVDAIQDQRQVVVKSLEANYRAIAGVTGATIMGDGRVALIVDIDALTRRGTLSVIPLGEAA